MKKLFLFCLLAVSISASAQRFSTGDFTGNVSGGAGGNTGAELNYGATFKALATTDSISPAYFESFYRFDTVRTAKTITIKTKAAKKWDKTSLEFVGDSLTAGRVITFQGTTGGKTVAITTTSGNIITVKKRKKALIVFLFDGDAWVEESRAVQF